MSLKTVGQLRSDFDAAYRDFKSTHPHDPLYPLVISDMLEVGDDLWQAVQKYKAEREDTVTL